jgi:hypothetical protein
MKVTINVIHLYSVFILSLTVVGIIELYFCFIILKQTIMKNLFKKQKTELDFSNLGGILSTSVATGAAIAKYSGKNPKTAGIISAGLSLLVTGLITAMDDDIPNQNPNNN